MFARFRSLIRARLLNMIRARTSGFLPLVLACSLNVAVARRVFSHVRAADGVRMCITPGGAHPCDCVHDIPANSRVKRNLATTSTAESNDVILPNGTVIHHPKCPHDTPSRPVPPLSSSLQQIGTTMKHTGDACALIEAGGSGYYHGRPMNSYYITDTGNFSRWNSTYSVPDTPAKTTSQTYLFYWIGLQDTRDANGSPVLQPVLSYTGSGVPNIGEPSSGLLEKHGSHEEVDAAVSWYFMSWNCCPAGRKYSAPYVDTTEGAEDLRGEVSCKKDGTCTVNSVNRNDQTSSLTLDNSNVGATSYNWAIVELETYYIDKCADYCSGTFGATAMSLYNSNGTEVSPTAPSAWTNNPYLQRTTASSPALQTDNFTLCCGGKFQMGWPAQYISQN